MGIETIENNPSYRLPSGGMSVVCGACRDRYSAAETTCPNCGGPA